MNAIELILAWQITSGSRGHGPMTFRPKTLYFLFFFRSLRSIFNFKQKFNKNAAYKTFLNKLTYNLTINMLNDFIVEPLKTSFA